MKGYQKSIMLIYAGLREKLCSPQFVNDLAVMHDTLGELSMLSEQLQNRSTTINQKQISLFVDQFVELRT